MPKLSVYKRGNVYWVDTYVEGRRVRRSTGCRSKTEAAHAADRQHSSCPTASPGWR